MSDAISQTERRDETDVRFSVRSLLIATAVVAVAAMAFGAFLRQFPADAQLRVLIYWGVMLALMTGIFARYARRRYRAETAAGRVFFRLTPHSYFLPRAPRFLAAMLGIGAIGLGVWVCMGAALLVAWYDFAEAWERFNWDLILDSLFGALYAAGGATYLWWHRRIRLCDRGFVVAHKFLPWAECERWYRDACYRDVIVTEWNRHGRVAAHVPPEERAAVEALLNEKLG